MREKIAINEDQRSQNAELSSRIGGYERCLTQRDAEISRLMSLASQLPECDGLMDRLQKGYESVEASLAAVNATRREALAVPVEASQEVLDQDQSWLSADHRNSMHNLLN